MNVRVAATAYRVRCRKRLELVRRGFKRQSGETSDLLSEELIESCAGTYPHTKRMKCKCYIAS